MSSASSATSSSAASVSRHTQTDTRRLIMRRARELMLSRSYLGLNFQVLADQVGIRKASLYHHFPSKEALGVALVDDARERFLQWTDTVKSETPSRQAVAYIKMFRDQIGAGERVCPVGATASEWELIDPALQDAVRALSRAHAEWVTGVADRLAKSANTDPQLMGGAKPRQWAAHVSALCQGALMMARLNQDPKVFDAAMAPLISRLNNLH
jgi:TetR/AcrR family transcriptional repressor of nem operon